MNTLQTQFDDLGNRVKFLEEKFIAPHLDNVLEAPDLYSVDTQAYCVLSHAAFEEFFENVCLYMLSVIDEKFGQPAREISLGTVCLLHFGDAKKLLEDSERWGDDERLNDYLEGAIKDRKSYLSTYAVMENHGIDLKYLRQLLMSVGIDIPHDPNIQSALHTLKEIRGSYAHGFSRAKKELSPEDAKKTVNDILSLASVTKDQAINMKFSPIK